MGLGIVWFELLIFHLALPSSRNNIAYTGVEAPVTDRLRYFASDLELGKAVQICRVWEDKNQEGYIFW